MVAITIRNVDDELKRSIKTIAAANGRSMEAEALLMLKRGVQAMLHGKPTGRAIRELVGPAGGIDLILPSRTANRKPPRLR